MPVDRLKSLFAKTLQDSKQHDTVGQSAFSEHSSHDTTASVSGVAEAAVSSRQPAPAAEPDKDELPMLAQGQGQNRQLLAALTVVGVVLVLLKV